MSRLVPRRQVRRLAHCGPQAVPMCGDWYARDMYLQGSGDYKYHVEHYGHPSTFGYKDVIALWKAEKFDPDRLMSLLQGRGAATSSRRPCIATTLICGTRSFTSGMRSASARSQHRRRLAESGAEAGPAVRRSEHVGYTPLLVSDQSWRGQDRSPGGRPLRRRQPEMADLCHPPSSRTVASTAATRTGIGSGFVRMKISWISAVRICSTPTAACRSASSGVRSWPISTTRKQLPTARLTLFTRARASARESLSPARACRTSSAACCPGSIPIPGRSTPPSAIGITSAIGSTALPVGSCTRWRTW